MFRPRVAPAPASTARPASFEWPEKWRQQVEKSIGPGAGAREIEEARRMGSALARMQQKELPSIKGR
jgi:hypothetical protein